MNAPNTAHDLQVVSTMRVMWRKRYLSVNKQRNIHWKQHADETRAVRGHARDLWLASDMLSQFPVIFVMQTFTPHECKNIPDVDSQAWLAKRILDGAIDAGVIPDDAHQYVSDVRLLDVQRSPAGAMDEWMHHAWFAAPC